MSGRGARLFRPDSLGRQHFIYYSSKTLRRLLEKNGFEVLATSKAVYRPGAGPLEPLRFLGIWLWQQVARWTRLRRELVLIATVAPKAN